MKQLGFSSLLPEFLQIDQVIIGLKSDIVLVILYVFDPISVVIG